MGLYKQIIRPILFRFDPEWIHNVTVSLLGLASRSPLFLHTLSRIINTPSLQTRQFGLVFPNPIGLAAGMDKDGASLPAWRALGFGFIELGAVTWEPQAGNPKPRLFRVIPREAIINRMGFNNPGAAAFAEQLRTWRASGLWPDCPVGVNIGKSRRVPLNEAPEDYSRTAGAIAPFVDFLVINVSSPNTPGLRELQDKAALGEILQAVHERLRKPRPTENQQNHSKPVLIKVAPELSQSALADVVEVALENDVAGLVATNTTTDRPAELDPKVKRLYAEEGGLSGRPLSKRSTEVIRTLYQLSQGRLPIIGVGGIFSLDDVIEKLSAGASLLQLYTGLIYEGPLLVRRLVRGLTDLLKQNGLTSFEELCNHLRVLSSSTCDANEKVHLSSNHLSAISTAFSAAPRKS